jgi:ABC-type Mn2+/Zn2+ transport system permease subunit
MFLFLSFGVIVIGVIALLIVLIKNKKDIHEKSVISVLAVLLVVVLGISIYVVSGSTARKNDLLSYLENKGYSHSEIQDTKITHSFASLFLGYPEWGD